jgi:hypothetical protein
LFTGTYTRHRVDTRHRLAIGITSAVSIGASIEMSTDVSIGETRTVDTTVAITDARTIVDIGGKV